MDVLCRQFEISSTDTPDMREGMRASSTQALPMAWACIHPSLERCTVESGDMASSMGVWPACPTSVSLFWGLILHLANVLGAASVAKARLQLQCTVSEAYCWQCSPQLSGAKSQNLTVLSTSPAFYSPSTIMLSNLLSRFILACMQPVV